MNDLKAVADKLIEFKTIDDIKKKIESAKSEEQKREEASTRLRKQADKDAKEKAQMGNADGFRQLIAGIYSPNRPAVMSPLLY